MAGTALIMLASGQPLNTQTACGGEDPAGRSRLAQGGEKDPLVRNLRADACQPPERSQVVGAFAMLGDVQTLTLHLFLDAQTHGQVNQLEQDERPDPGEGDRKEDGL